METFTQLTQLEIDKFVSDLENLQKESERLHLHKFKITKEKWRWFYEDLQEDICNKIQKVILDFKKIR